MIQCLNRKRVSSTTKNNLMGMGYMYTFLVIACEIEVKDSILRE